MIIRKKKRSDRKHVIYLISNTVNKKEYIGITVIKARSNPKKSLLTRWKAHVYRAFIELSSLPLATEIRQFGEDAFELAILEIVRGKKEAILAENRYINQRNTVLNMSNFHI